jgi:hypothetical protein
MKVLDIEAPANILALAAEVIFPSLALSGGVGISALTPLLGDKRTSVGSTKPIYEYTA